ncbi:MAG: hypothetical protein ACOYXM_00480 [Actinomycetota bacterium]
MDAESTRPWPSLGAASGLFVVVAGLVIGLRPLADNSFFTHLATGRIILDSGAVPSSDPYSFTAAGSPWLVQSWLASVLYAGAEKLGGATGLRLLAGLVAAGVTVLGWRLTRTAESLLPRLAIGAAFVAVGAGMWAERPLMLGLLALGMAVLAGRGELDPRWLVPIGWLWVNVHGSFPLGVLYLGVVAVGTMVDGQRPSTEVRALCWLTGGVVLGAVGPLGPSVLLFPFELVQRQDVLQNVIEWRAPTFESFSQRAFLLQLVLAVLALVRLPSYREGLVVAVFAPAALLGSRNIAVASLLLVPVLADAAPRWGSLRSTTRSRLAAVLGVLGVSSLVLLSSVRIAQDDFELSAYPVDALAFVDEKGVDLAQHRLAAMDIVGNFMELIYGPRGEVFYDDRFDMFPDRVSNAHLALVHAERSLVSELDEFEIELVLAELSSASAQRLSVDPAWRVLYSDELWLLVCRREARLDGELGVC